MITIFCQKSIPWVSQMCCGVTFLCRKKRVLICWFFQEGGDLKKKREMFAKQREEMKQAGKLDGLREKRRSWTADAKTHTW